MWNNRYAAGLNLSNQRKVGRERKRWKREREEEERERRRRERKSKRE